VNFRREAGVRSVVYASGFTCDCSWIDLPVFDERGYPRYERGITELPGLYFVGLDWMHTAGSGLGSQVGRDAQYVVLHMNRHCRSGRSWPAICWRSIGNGYRAALRSPGMTAARMNFASFWYRFEPGGRSGNQFLPLAPMITAASACIEWRRSFLTRAGSLLTSHFSILMTTKHGYAKLRLWQFPAALRLFPGAGFSDL